MQLRNKELEFNQDMISSHFDGDIISMYKMKEPFVFLLFSLFKGIGVCNPYVKSE